jgi:hypothetical protein
VKQKVTPRCSRRAQPITNPYQVNNQPPALPTPSAVCCMSRCVYLYAACNAWWPVSLPLVLERPDDQNMYIKHDNFEAEPKVCVV